MVGRLHPTVRGELLIGAAVFLLGAAIGVLWEAADAMLTARRAEREQLRGAGALLDQLEDERDELQRQLDAGEASPQFFHTREQLRQERDELLRERDELQARMVAAAVAPLPLDAVREAIAKADDGELLRDALARTRCACETGHGVCYCGADELAREPEPPEPDEEPAREQDGADGPGAAP